MNLKNTMLSTGIEYYQEIWNIYKKIKKLKAFQKIVAIFLHFCYVIKNLKKTFKNSLKKYSLYLQAIPDDGL